MRSFFVSVIAALIASSAYAGEVAPAQTAAAGRSYCVNAAADFYEYTGGPCRSGYQLGPGNCRMPDGGFRAVPADTCSGLGGMIALPAPPALDSGRLLRPRVPGQ